MERNELIDNIKFLRAGTDKGVRWLIDNYAQRLFRFFHRNGIDKSESEDLTQEVFIRVIKSIQRYKEQEKFDIWIFRIAHNLLIDHWRKRKVRVETDFRYEDGNLFDQRIESNQKSPASNLITKEETDILQDALMKLSAEQRETILMRYFGQMSFEEIAKITGQPIGTVLSQVHRGLKRLKTLIRGAGYE